MTDTNFRSSDPTNKSSDNLEEKNTHIDNLINQLENSKNQLEKVCFNPYCNDKGNRWIDIVGTPVGVRDNEIPYCLCDECYSCIVRKLTESEEIDSNHDYYLVGRRLVGELHELATYATNDESFNSMPKVYYKNSCKNEGKHWIRVYDDIIIGQTDEEIITALFFEMPYWMCDKCYEFFEDRRKGSSIYAEVLLRGRQVSGVNLVTGNEVKSSLNSRFEEEEYRNMITIRDWSDLLESTKSYQRERD
jgi:hypothetical protein